MNIRLEGPADASPVILLHGFPESHRTWRKLEPLLSDKLRLIMPDLRGFGDSDRPRDPEAYRTESLVEDIAALATALGLGCYALVGHDWGGAIAWAAALRDDPKITRLAIINSPHPLIFQKSLIENDAQRLASQYIRAFRNPDFEKFVDRIGYGAFFDRSFDGHVDIASITPSERQAYIDEWSRPGALTAMLNWYRASAIKVPDINENADLPAWVARGVPKLRIPVRVIWGMNDKALLPVQLEGIGEVGDDVEVFPLNGVGHFAPWEAPEKVAAVLKPFLLAS